MKQYVKSSKGYYYQILKNGTKKRISQEEYFKKSKKLNGGTTDNDIKGWIAEGKTLKEINDLTIKFGGQLYNYTDCFELLKKKFNLSDFMGIYSSLYTVIHNFKFNFIEVFNQLVKTDSKIVAINKLRLGSVSLSDFRNAKNMFFFRLVTDKELVEGGYTNSLQFRREFDDEYTKTHTEPKNSSSNGLYSNAKKNNLHQQYLIKLNEYDQNKKIYSDAKLIELGLEL